MKVPYIENITVVINLDDAIVEIIKNGKHYSLDEYLALKIEDLLDMRMREEQE